MKIGVRKYPKRKHREFQNKTVGKLKFEEMAKALKEIEGIIETV